MTTEFDPKLAEYVARGQTAALILDAVKMLCDGCVEQVLKQLDQHVMHGNLTPEKAVGLCHELAAFRRIVQRQMATIRQGEAAQAAQTRLREA